MSAGRIPTALALRLEDALDAAARSLNAAYALNRKARTTGDPTARWEAETALACAQRDVRRYAGWAGLTYEVALKEAEARRPEVGALTIPVR